MLVAKLAAAMMAIAAAAVVLQGLEVPQAEPEHCSQY